MAIIFFNGRRIEAEDGRRLRTVLKEAGVSPHNGRAELANCRGFGTCGTCAVEVQASAVPPLSPRERMRLKIPPHRIDSGLRLACQIKVEGEMHVRKYPGFWGQHVEQTPKD